MCSVLQPAAVWNHRMTTSTALDHVRADRAWHYLDTARTATTPPIARPEAVRNHKGRSRAGFSITGMTTTHANRNKRNQAHQGRALSGRPSGSFDQARVLG